MTTELVDGLPNGKKGNIRFQELLLPENKIT